MKRVKELGPVSGGGFDLAGLLQGVSELDTEEQIVRLPLDRLDPDPDNFYSLDGLDELAGNIETVGLLDPIRVRPNGDRYTVVSGHRRRAACLLIRDGGNKMFDRGVPCIVEYGEASDAMRRLRLIFANSHNRQLTSQELSLQAEETTRIFYELEKQGVQFPGRMQEHVAQALNVHASKLKRLHAIRNRAQEYVLDAFDSGEMNESVAYEMQKLAPSLQKQIMVNQRHMGHKIEALTAEDVTTLGALYAKIVLTPCKRSANGTCVYTDTLFDKAQRELHCEAVTDACAKGRCCLYCRNIGECKDVCPRCRAEKQNRIDQLALEKKQREEIAERIREASERDRKQKDAETAKVWRRIARAAKESGKDLEEVFDNLCETEADVQACIRFCQGKEKDMEHIGLELLDDCFIDLADALGCSVDFMLGRTEVVKTAYQNGPATVALGVEEPVILRAQPEGSPGRPGERSLDCARDDKNGTLRSAQDDSEKDARKDRADGWQDGTPEREGWYAVRSTWRNDANLIYREILYFRDGLFYEDDRCKRSDPDTYVHFWFPLPEEE